MIKQNTTDERTHFLKLIQDIKDNLQIKTLQYEYIDEFQNTITSYKGSFNGLLGISELLLNQFPKSDNSLISLQSDKFKNRVEEIIKTFK